MVREKIRQTNLEKYGEECVLNIPEVQEKRRKTCLEKYGYECSLKNEEVRQKSRETCREKYGYNYSCQNPEVREKIRNTTIEKYGVPFYSQTEEAHRHRKASIEFDGVYFDSSWELHWYQKWKADGKTVVRHPCKLRYTCEGEEHYYIPDFMVDGELIEIKGPQFFKDGKMINPFSEEDSKVYEAKYQCMLQNNVTIITEDVNDNRRGV